MTKEETIELAKQSGMNYRNFEDEFYSGNTDGVWIEHLEAFAKLTAKNEREAIAQMVEPWLLPEYVRKIRERGQK